MATSVATVRSRRRKMTTMEMTTTRFIRRQRHQSPWQRLSAEVLEGGLSGAAMALVVEAWGGEAESSGDLIVATTIKFAAVESNSSPTELGDDQIRRR